MNTRRQFLISAPHGVTIVGRLFDDGLIGWVGLALEREFGAAGERPADF